MSHELIFSILPFDPWLTPEDEIRLSIDLDNLKQQLQDKWPNVKITTYKDAEGEVVRLYISTKSQGEWNIAGYSTDYCQFYVNGWPKPIAKEIILWYRQFVPEQYRLFLVSPENDYAAELTSNNTLDDIESFYPYS